MPLQIPAAHARVPCAIGASADDTEMKHNQFTIYDFKSGRADTPHPRFVKGVVGF